MGGVSSEGTSDDEGIISLDFGGVYPMKNIIDQCTFNYYTDMKVNFEDILGIINNLDYTSFNIGGDLFSSERSLNDQTLRLTDFDDSLALYYEGIKEMESNICSKLGGEWYIKCK